jgi:hypothetical protein
MPQEERSIFWEAIVSIILSKKVYVCMCPIPNGFKDRAISLYSFKLLIRKILRTVYNIGIYCSSDKVGTLYLVQYIFENCTVSINALCCNACEGMACCSSAHCTVYRTVKQNYLKNRSEYDTCTLYILLLRMTDAMTSQNTGLSSWNILHMRPPETISAVYVTNSSYQ